jgi:ABC-type nitrate/sulfonate/bicarbonate transport system permease component
VIAFGIGIESKICLVAVTVFFLVLFSTIDGIRDVDPTCSAAVLKMN